MRVARLLALALATGGLAGCATPAPEEYMNSRDSLFYLQQLPATPVGVGAIAGAQGAGSQASIPGSLVTCPRSGEDGDASAYVRNALVQELTAAGLYSDDAVVTRISGSIEDISLSRRIPFEAVWRIGLRLQSSNGSQLAVAEELRFDIGSLAGPSVCKRAIGHFEPAVRAVLEKAIASPDFARLMAPA